MSRPFDPYHVWLGIPPAEQPPNHYRLLGISLFESDPEVIATAADRQMSHLRTYQTGRHSDLSQKLLNETAAAKICLLKPEKKTAYDDLLHQQLEPNGSGEPEPDGDQPIDAGLAQLFQKTNRDTACLATQVAARRRLAGLVAFVGFVAAVAVIFGVLVWARGLGRHEAPWSRSLEAESQATAERTEQQSRGTTGASSEPNASSGERPSQPAAAGGRETTFPDTVLFPKTAGSPPDGSNPPEASGNSDTMGSDPRAPDPGEMAPSGGDEPPVGSRTDQPAMLPSTPEPPLSPDAQQKPAAGSVEEPRQTPAAEDLAPHTSGAQPRAQTVVRPIAPRSFQQVRRSYLLNEQPGARWGVIDNKIVMTSDTDQAWMAYKESFQSISLVVVRGGIVPPGKHNFRLAIGPLLLVFNSDAGNENYFRDLGQQAAAGTTTTPAALVPGVIHTIQVAQNGENAVVTVDGKQQCEIPVLLAGTVSFFTYQSGIAIEKVLIEGVSDPDTEVTGPSHPW